MIKGLFYYDTSALEQLLAVKDATVFAYDNSGWTQIPGWTADAPDIRIAMAQGIDTVLISDGQGPLQIYNGTTFVSAGEANPANAPIGARILVWHTGRMFASGIAALPDTIFVSNRLDFSSGNWNAVSRSFRIGFGDGDPIMAMASMQNFTLCVLKQNSIWLVSTDPLHEPADFSTNQDYAALSQGIGCVGNNAWCAYQNDVLFMAQDGIRSVQRMQSAAGQWQLSAPISQPIQPYIDRINRNAWGGICAKKYQEFAFFFVPLDNSTTNNCVLVWNGRLGKWSGIFTGWNGQAVEITRFGGVNKFVFGDTAGLVQQWKDSESLTDDATYTDNGVGYPTKLWSRSGLFGDAIVNKTAYNTIVRFSQGNATVNLTWVADAAVATTWTAQPEPSGSILGGEDLLGSTFVLQSTAAISVKRGIRGLKAFNEAYIRLETDTGWIAVRNLTFSAFLNPLQG